jgi:phytanoyl-CoA hydroxylase
VNTRLTKEQIETYRRDGVLIYRGFLSDRETDTMVSDITEAIGKMGTNIVAGNKDFGAVPMADTTDFYARVFLQRVNMWKVSDAIKRTFLGTELGEMLCRLEGVDGMRVWHDQTLQ